MEIIEDSRKLGKLRHPLPMAGKCFNKLTVVRYAGRTGNEKRPTWECICICGKLTNVLEKHLLSGHTKSCGCIKNHDKVKHGHKRRTGQSATYTTWQSMIQRCHDPDFDSFKDYGAKGISVCERWLTFSSFLEDMGDRPIGKTLDRIDGKGNYEPGNCRWAGALEQANKKRSNQKLECDGVSMTIAEWSQRTGLDYGCLYKRVFQLGWTPERALTTPSRKEKNNGIR